MKNYFRVMWDYIDQFDKSENNAIRIIRIEFYLIAILVLASATLGVIFQFIFTIWFLPKIVIENGIDQIILQYGSQLTFINDPWLAIRTSWIIIDIIMFLVTTFIILKIKRKVRNHMKDKIEDLEQEL